MPSLPAIGFGTWQLDPAEARTLTRAALDRGYRLLDTATLYGNEQAVGRAVRESWVPRDQIWITTKLLPQEWRSAATAIGNSLRALETDYVDLWLLHAHPGADVTRAWEAMLAQQQQGRVRYVGVSNFRLRDVLELVPGGTPSVLQLPWSPWRHRRDRLRWCEDLGVQVQGYSPLRSSELGHPVLCRIAGKYGRTPAQVVLRWSWHHAIPVLSTSRDPGRLEENLHSVSFDLDREDIERLDGLAGRPNLT